MRLAAQELLVAELKNMGPSGRKHLVEVQLYNPYNKVTGCLSICLSVPL